MAAFTWNSTGKQANMHPLSQALPPHASKSQKQPLPWPPTSHVTYMQRQKSTSISSPQKDKTSTHKIVLWLIRNMAN
jgi:hypothetical protein